MRGRGVETQVFTRTNTTVSRCCFHQTFLFVTCSWRIVGRADIALEMIVGSLTAISEIPLEQSEAV
jgi:hypothetical protein